MCGIAGLVNYNSDYVKGIQQSLFHRGPDAQTSYKFKNIHLIHTRLSIQDLEHGSQPFVIGNHVIIFNGEIYNHLELRSKVTHYQFKTKSDTETLLALYMEHGASALQWCDGMFAFVILDKSNNRLVLARDRVGKKPLYLFNKNNQIFFASELNALLHSLPHLSVNEDAIYAYLRTGFFNKQTTPYCDVECVLPGYIYEIDLRSLTVERNKYFEILDYYKKPKLPSDDNVSDTLDSILHRSIKDRLVSSDLEVGAFLSGGIDSSLIVAIASQYVNQLKTFSVKFEGSYDESPLARQTAQRYKTDHYEIPLKMDLANDVEGILARYGEPFMDSSAVPSFYVSREAKKHVSVALNGDGADELFAGYRRYVPIANNWINFARYFTYVTKKLPYPKNKFNKYNYLYRLLNISCKRNLDFYLAATTDLFEDSYAFHSNSILDELSAFIESVNQEDISSLSKMLVLDSNLILPSDLLKKMDIATMSHSLEGRSPFLSKYFLEWVPRLQDSDKINGLQTKYILRQLSKRYLDKNITSQPKRGFEVPLTRWVNHDLKANIFDKLGANSYAQSYVNPRFIKKLLENKIDIAPEKRAKVLWDLYALEVWHDNYLNYSPSAAETDRLYDVVDRDKILMLTTGLGLGGAERVVLDICRKINSRLFKVDVIGVSTQVELLSEFKKNNISVQALGFKKSFFSVLKTFHIVFNFVRENDIKIIHAHMFHTLLIASAIKILNPTVKVIFTAHNTFSSMLFRQWVIYFLKPFRTVDTIFSPRMISFFHKQNNTIIANGIDVCTYNPNPNPNPNPIFTFIIVGRLEIMKNHEFLINLVSELKGYNFQLKIVGTGILEEKLKKQVATLGLNDRVEFLGGRRDVPELLSHADCLLLPSLWEAFPIVLLEAGACGVPVITTPVGCIPDFISKESGCLVELDGFKDAMIDIMDNYQSAQEKAELLLSTVKSQYNIEKIVKQYEDLYQDLLL